MRFSAGAPRSHHPIALQPTGQCLDAGLCRCRKPAGANGYGLVMNVARAAAMWARMGAYWAIQLFNNRNNH